MAKKTVWIESECRISLFIVQVVIYTLFILCQ